MNRSPIRFLAAFWLAAILWTLVLPSFAVAQTEQSEEPPGLPLPTNRSSWLNAPPLDERMLEDKAVLFWFFEET